MNIGYCRNGIRMNEYNPGIQMVGDPGEIQFSGNFGARLKRNLRKFPSR